MLILRVRQLSGSRSSLHKGLSSFGLRCEKSLANLEHILRCLHQAALEALISNSLKRLEGEVVNWYHYWRQRRLMCLSWFSESSNGRRSLSTTWPWNIKPSLIILWGVCWMFYPDGESTRTPGQAEVFPNPLWTGHTPQPPQQSISPNPREWQSRFQECSHSLTNWT